MSDCKFCGEGKYIIGISENDKQINRIIYENDNFYVMVSVGAIVAGHLLIIPKKHYLSMGELPNNLLKEMVYILNIFKKILKEQYRKEIIIFEHGTGKKVPSRWKKTGSRILRKRRGLNRLKA